MKFKTCTPQKIPLKSLDWSSLACSLGKAHAILAQFDDLIQRYPRVVFSSLLAQETFASIHSQNIKAKFESILAGEQQGDLIKIINYQKALLKAASAISKKPLSLTLIRQAHAKVKQNSKALKKDLAAFRGVLSYEEFVHLLKLLDGSK